MSRDVITKPCIVGGMDEDWYHSPFGPVAEGSLSSSGAKLLLPPNCPAIFEHQRRHGKPPTRAMDLGTVVHGMVLGTGQEVEIIDYPNYQSGPAKEAKAKAIAAGRVPMLVHQHGQAQEIARAVIEHPTAGALFAEGDSEQSIFWQDAEFGIWLRGRTDFLTYLGETPIIVDLKTAASASPEKFAKSADEYGYFMQDPHYREGLAAILGCDWADIDFLFVVVPTEQPYLPMIYRLGDEDVALGRERNRIAREKYRDCSEAGVWPAWSDDIEELRLPVYARRRIEGEINAWYG